MSELAEVGIDRMEIVDDLKKHAGWGMAEDVRRGLLARRKFIPSKYFYDARGSRLFDEICDLPEYYLTRTEISLLRENAAALTKGIENGDLVELGSGANRKIRTLLHDMGQERRAETRYVPVDVSRSALVAAAHELLRIYPELYVLGVLADFTSDLQWLPKGRPKLILFLGSTIGNLSEMECKTFLEAVSGALQPGDRFVLAMDMVKDVEILEAAYNDAQRVTEEFNKNILLVLNRRLGADFRIDDFDHVAFYNDECQRVEMHLRANRSVNVAIPRIQESVVIRKGETIQTEICRKFTPESAGKMIEEAGLTIAAWHFSPENWFAHAEVTRVE
jgi:L-histidine Nalpha-methyltransferase